MPGKIGSAIETRRLRRVKSALGPAAVSEFERRLSMIESNAIGLDLGANVGDYTLILAKYCSIVHAFEPDPWTFARLRERVGHLPNVVLHNVAVACADETVMMRRNTDFSVDPERASVGTSILKYSDGLPIGETLMVDCIDFRRFLRGIGREVAVIKVDIEGAEVPLLEVLLNSPELELISAMFVETHEVNMPTLRRRVSAIRRRIDGLKTPYINLDWP